jgi:chemotaxis protein MotB
MTINLAAAARVIPLTALLLAACVSEKTYEAQTQQLQQARAQAASEQQQLAKLQAENKWVVAGDMLFPEGGYQLTPSGQAALSQYVLRLQSLQNAKVVVYGYTDNLAVGPALQQAGIKNNIDLSSRRADNVVAYFRSQGVNPNILSAKGFGDTHPVASNDTPDGRAKNRRIEIVLEGPGAS